MSAPLALAAPTPAELADEAVRAVLRAQWEGVAAVRLDSPPGAGKTGVVERLAVQSLALLRERCMVATMTNEQAFDLARRLAGGYPRLPFTLFVRDGLATPDDLPGLPNLQLARASAQVPAAGPCVVIANAARWSWSDATAFARFDLLVVDEAFQLPDHRFQQIAGLARRLVLVGDPGQIPPVVTGAVERWRCDPAGPHVACPRALVARHPGIRRLALPVSRRLVADTVWVVQPAFYPELPFTALAAPGERGLVTRVAGATPLDRAIDLAERGASLVQVELPAQIMGEVDEAVADTIVGLIRRLADRGTRVRDDGAERPLDPGMVGVVCAHVAQVNAVRERLPRSFADVLVETADRFQGLERPVILDYHPLSGRADADEFHLDSGRMCVALSRHRVACFVVARAGIKELLLRHAPGGDRVLGSDEDREYEGWRAQVFVVQALRRQGRVVALG
ncbi:MAG: ATP-binding protein [Chloroflexi bacterium]|nr:ATP-binding protein [Chloroflexota bacterium]